jgi:hypothetical protein
LHKILFSCLLASAAIAAEPGFKDIFNGQDLTGWTLIRGRGPGYVVENGVLVCPAEGGGNLLTDRDYANFVLRFDFKMEPGGNNGLGIRAPLEGDIAYTGIELQILDHDHDRYKGQLKPTQRHGSLYDVFPATADTLKPAGEWNSEEVTVDGTRVKVVLNGTTILDADTSTVTDPAILKKHPGLLRKSGRIGFLGHGTRVEFRNIRLKEL